MGNWGTMEIAHKASIRCQCFALGAVLALLFLPWPCFAVQADSAAQVLWETSLADNIDSIVRLGNRTHLLLRGKETVYLLRARDGHVEWTYPIAEKMRTFVVKRENTLIAMGESYTLIINLISKNPTRIEGRLEAPFHLEDQKSLIVLMNSSSVARIALDQPRVLWQARLRSKLSDVMNYTLDPENGACLIFGRTGQTAVLATINLADGKLRWETELRGSVEEPAVARHITPILREDGIYVELGGLSRLDRSSGEYRWYTAYSTFEPRDHGSGGGRSRAKQASRPLILERPNAAPVFEKEEVLTAARGRVRNIDLKTGKVKWESKDYDLVSLLVPHQGSAVAVTGGIFRAAVKQVSMGQLLLAIASTVGVGTRTGGRIVAPTYSSTGEFRAQTAPWQEEIEEVDYPLMISGEFRHKKPGVAALDWATGKEIYSHAWTTATSGLYADGKSALIADGENIHRVDLENGDSKTLFSVKESGLGKEISYVIPSATNMEQAVVFTPKPAIGKIQLSSGRVLWSADLGRRIFNFVPLACDGTRVVVLCETKTTFSATLGIVTLDERNGAVLWDQTVPIRGWSMYLDDGVIVQHERKTGKVLYSVGNGWTAKARGTQ